MNSRFVILFGFVYSLFSNFPIEIIFSFLSIALFLSFAKKRNIPFSIQFYFGLFFIQIVMTLIFLDLTKDELVLRKFNFEVIKELELISIIHLLIAIISFYLVFRNRTKINRESILSDIFKIKFRNLLIFYFVMSFIFPILSLLSVENSSLQQFFMALASLKDLALILFVFHLLVLKSNRLIIFGILFFEFLLGFISYFSSFKNIIIYFIIVSLTTTISKGLSFKSLRLIVPLFFFAIYTMTFWSYVKGDYRALLRDGENGQSVNVENAVAANYIIDQFSHFGIEEFNLGVINFFGRAQYLEEYHTVVQNVPSILPHENGRIILDALEFITTPRFLNPNKKILDPSLKTAKYTGREVATAEMGTSISLGFFADFYIEFGFAGMIIPLIFLFMALGLFCKRIFTNKNYNPIFNISMLIAIVTNIGTFE